MAAPDMDVIKEIPGYKVILKAVLKSQIQQLVEQLASHTDEESVILTASVSDGTLSHLGSDSGKFFLQDHEDIKSQFLGFCLKRHHRKKQEKDREEELQRLQFSPRHMAAQPSRYPPARQGVHPVSLARASPGSHVRSPGARHEPYSVPRPRRSLNQNLSNQSPADSQKTMTLPTNNQVIKIEPQDEGSNQSAGDINNQRQSEKSSSPPSSPLHGQGSIVKTDNADESSTSATANEASELPFSETQPAEGLGLDSDLSNLISGEQSVKTPTTSSGQASEIDPDVNVKLESISESDMELEITGVEPGPGSVSSQDTSWAQNTSMGYDSSGATGNQADLQGQEGFNVFMVKNTEAPSKSGEQSENIDTVTDGTPGPPYNCFCGKVFKRKNDYRRHYRVHTGSRLVQCPDIQQQFNLFFKFQCEFCQRPFNNKWKYECHRRTHTGEKPYKCDKCGKAFSIKGNLKKHGATHLAGDILDLN